MLHFTYENSLENNSLYQGDVLKRTPELESVLREIHPYYCQKKDDYRFFIVLTQSCDLIRRSGGLCTANYITIAAVRPLCLVVEREAFRLQYNDELDRQLGICDKKRRIKLEQFLARLFNNNEQNYFFLNAEPVRDFNQDYCAFLQLSIPLKAELHYEKLLSAKILQLTESFQHKLGYLTGAPYIRVATEDWADKKVFQKKINESIEKVNSLRWLENLVYKEVRKELKTLPKEEQTIENLKSVIKNFKHTKAGRINEVLDIISQDLQELNVDASLIKQLCKRLGNRSEFRTLIK